MIYLCSFIFYPSATVSRFKAGTWIVYSLTIFLLCIFLFFNYLQIKAGHSLDFSFILKYQHIFYLSGFTMLPLPRTPDVWHLVISVYLLGLIAAILNWEAGKRPVRGEMVFCLSLLGIALFIYFQGRSHPNVLIIATWPAQLLFFIVCDVLLVLIKARRLPKVFMAISLPVLFFGLLTATTFLFNIPYLCKSAINRWHTMLIAQGETPIVRNLRFIQSHLYGRKEAVIMAPNQAVYYAESHLASPIKGPGASEILLHMDLNNFTKELLSNENNLFYKPNYIDNSLDPYLQETISLFRGISQSDEGMVLLEKKQ